MCRECAIALGRSEPGAARCGSEQACRCGIDRKRTQDVPLGLLRPRASDYDGSVTGAQSYFSGLSVDADPEAIGAEREQVTRALTQLPPARYLEVGAGP